MANVHQFDVVVVGAGGAGLMAGLYASRGAWQLRGRQA